MDVNSFKFIDYVIPSGVKKTLMRNSAGQCLLELIQQPSAMDLPENFGYTVLGPLVVGFCHWVKNLAEKLHIPQLNFLSRDMKICYDVWQILNTECAIPTNYLLASRRAVSVASIKSLSDLIQLIRETKFSQPIDEYFANRFSFQVTDKHHRALQQSGLQLPQQHIQFAKHLPQLEVFVRLIWDELKTSILKEREAYIQYLNHMNFAAAAGIVDLGYSGTTQKYLHLLSGKSLSGFYIGTMTGICKLAPYGLSAHSFLVHKAHRHTNHAFFRNIPLMEYLFLDKEKSLMCFHTNNATVEPLYLSPDEKLFQDRISFTTRIHNGVLAFARDWRNRFGSDVHLDDHKLAFSMCAATLDHPTQQNARLFAGHYFEDNYGKSNKTVCLLAKEQQFAPSTQRKAIKISQWKIAAYVLAKRKFRGKYWLSRLKRNCKQLLL